MSATPYTTAYTTPLSPINWGGGGSCWLFIMFSRHHGFSLTKLHSSRARTRSYSRHLVLFLSLWLSPHTNLWKPQKLGLYLIPLSIFKTSYSASLAHTIHSVSFYWMNVLTFKYPAQNLSCNISVLTMLIVNNAQYAFCSFCRLLAKGIFWTEGNQMTKHSFKWPPTWRREEVEWRYHRHRVVLLLTLARVTYWTWDTLQTSKVDRTG